MIEITNEVVHQFDEFSPIIDHVLFSANQFDVILVELLLFSSWNMMGLHQ